MREASAYVFASEAQKQACLRTGLAETLLLDPAAAPVVPGLGRAPPRLLAAGPSGQPYAVDADWRLCGPTEAGPRVEGAERLVVGPSRIWILGRDDLHQFDRRSLQHLLTIPAKDVIDIAAAGDGLWCLDGKARIRRSNADGRPGREFFQGSVLARALALVGDSLFLLSADFAQLELINVGDASAVAIDLTELLASAGGAPERPKQFGAAELIQGDDRLLIRRLGGGSPDYLVLDGNGTVVARGRAADEAKIAAIGLARGDLLAAIGDEGPVRRYAGAAAGDGARWLTPALETGSHTSSWIRAEIRAVLPEGATLSLRSASLPDEALRESVEAVQTDRRRSIGERASSVMQMLAPHFGPEFTYAGEKSDGSAPAVQTLDFPLERSADPFLWLYVKLRRNDASSAPSILGMTVHHGPDGLIEHLPAIYRSDGDGDGTLARLVGVLEATTHGIDRQIAALADRLDPDRAPESELPGLAQSLGLPFDAALTGDMQRRLVAAAGALLAGRGTRHGLHALFRALFPGRPVNIVDRSEVHLPIELGGGGFEGSRLPAMLNGPSRQAPRLNARLVLGATPLSPPEGDGMVSPIPEVLVSIPASGRERRRFAAAAQQMGEMMVPAGVRLRLRWTHWPAPHGDYPEDCLAVVDAPAPLRLGQDITGRASVGGGIPRVEQTSLSAAGHRLQ